MKLKLKATKKDWYFTVIAALVLGNLGLGLAQTAGALMVFPGSATLWAYCIAGMIAIFGLIWWMRETRKRTEQRQFCMKCQKYNNCDISRRANANPMTFYCAFFELEKYETDTTKKSK